MKLTKYFLMLSKAQILGLGLALSFGTSNAATLMNGTLTVDIRDDNGAIDTVTFAGTDYFNPGTSVSDWGFQIGTDTSTFRYNDTSGFTQQTVTVSTSGANVNVTGLYSGEGYTLAFTRTYRLIPLENKLAIDMSITNAGLPVNFRTFETFDPDQGEPLGVGYDTNNDVYVDGAYDVGESWTNNPAGNYLGVLLSSLSSNSPTIAAGGPFQIDNGTALNSFFTTPVDGGNVSADQGLHIGYEKTLETGSGITYTTYLEFNTVPEPSTALLSALGILGLLRRRRM